MNTTKILQSAGLKPDGIVFSLDNEETVERLLETIKQDLATATP